MGMLSYTVPLDVSPLVSTCNITAEYVVAGYGLISLPSTVKAILSKLYIAFLRNNDNSYNVLGSDIKAYWVRTYSAVMLQLDVSDITISVDRDV